MSLYGLIGKSLGHSFSKAWFNAKFEREGLHQCSYQNFELNDIGELPALLSTFQPDGLNVTTPYKEEVIPFLTEIDAAAEKIGAVNTIKRLASGSLRGYNTDIIGFRDTLIPLLKPYHTAALIFGTGGASKAVSYVLDELGIDYRFVSRSKQGGNVLDYDHLLAVDVRNAPLLIQTTPVGTFPNVREKPDIPYSGIDKFHLLYDLVYNPAESAFLQAGRLRGANTCNGYAMLIAQAEAAWSIWRSDEAE